MINKIGKITLYVNNQDEAKKFWTEKLNFVVKLEQPMGPNMKWLEVAPNEGEFTTFILYDKNLMKAQNPSTNVEHPSLLLSTTDIDSSYDKMKANGVEVGELMKMPYGKMFTFKDQDGNQYMLREDKQSS
jgi:lactoylglutathione lyase